MANVIAVGGDMSISTFLSSLSVEGPGLLIDKKWSRRRGADALQSCDSFIRATHVREFWMVEDPDVLIYPFLHLPKVGDARTGTLTVY